MRQDICLVGNITFEENITEAEITNQPNRFRPKNIGECKIEVYGPNEGPIPHFHITSLNGKFKCCVGIYDNHFFSHGNKYRGVLNSRQCKQLDDWLKKQNSKSLSKTTNWQAIAGLWEMTNPDCKYPNNRKCTKQPDYSIMSSFMDV